jgi:hypothetical protein
MKHICGMVKEQPKRNPPRPLTTTLEFPRKPILALPHAWPYERGEPAYSNVGISAVWSDHRTGLLG